MQSSDPLYNVVHVSPLEKAAHLSRKTNNDVYLKREDTQIVHSFKIRGAFNRIASLTSSELEKGVICASAGNHAQGVALSAKYFGTSALVVMPMTTPEIKVQAVRELGAEVELHGDNYSEAADYCMQRIKQTGRVFIHPFDDPLVIEGQGTIGLEILEQCDNVDMVFVPVGGGGLIAGVARAIKEAQPHVQIIGVEPEDSAAMGRSLAEQKRVNLSHVGVFADGVAVRQVGVEPFAIAQKYVDKMITVTNDEICDAIKTIYQENRSLVEPAGALAVAGFKKLSTTIHGAHVVCINSGANMSFEKLQYIAERTLIGSGREKLFAISLPETAGALMTLCRDVIQHHSITEFGYRLQKRNQATILVGISVSDTQDAIDFCTNLASHGYSFTDLTDDDVTKEHIRHMVGGVSPEAVNETIYSVELPERPGALVDLLTDSGSHLNISLFHYRNLGGDTGRVLIGFESQQDMSDQLRNFDPQKVSDLPSVKTFLIP